MDNDIIVGVDADGVLTNLIEHNIREGKKVFKKEVLNPNEYDLEKIFDLSDYSKLVKYAKAFQIYENYCKNEKSREGVAEVINELTNDGFKFNQITARKFAAEKNILGKRYRNLLIEWNKKHNINFDNYKFCSEYNVANKKLIACSSLDVEIMIEDNASVALELANNQIKVLLVNAPYNQGVEHENIIRVNSWYDIKNELINYKENKLENKFSKNFKKLNTEEVKKLTDEEKNQYFSAYKRHLKSLKINEKAFKVGEKRFKIIFKSLELPVKKLLKVKTEGQQNVPYEDGFIVTSNHIDSYDQFIVGLAIGNRPFTGLAASTIENTIRGKMFKFTNGAIFVDRKDKESRKTSSDELSKRIAHGKTALIFPEGTRKNKSEEGKLKFQLPFNLGAVSMAQKTGAPILPTAINHFDNYSIVRVGTPIIIKPTDDLVEINRRLEEITAKLSWENMEYDLSIDENRSELNKVYKLENNIR